MITKSKLAVYTIQQKFTRGFEAQSPWELTATVEQIYAVFDGRLGHLQIPASLEQEAPYVAKTMVAVEQAKAIALAYRTDHPGPLEIRGKLFDRQALCQALLLQYVVFKYERWRGQLRQEVGTERAVALAARMYALIDRPGMAWITTACTTTTEHNLAVAEDLATHDMLLAAEIDRVEPEGERLRVHFVQQEQIVDTSAQDVDYVYRLDGVVRDPEYPKHEQIPDPDEQLSDADASDNVSDNASDNVSDNVSNNASDGAQAHQV